MILLHSENENVMKRKKCHIPNRLHPRQKRATNDVTSRKSRIVGGAVTRIEEFPWQVSLQTGGAHVCGGSIVLNNYVLTAAHCTNVFDRPSDWEVLAGVDRSTSSFGGVKRSVVEIILGFGWVKKFLIFFKKIFF